MSNGRMKVGDLYKDKGNRLLLKEILYSIDFEPEKVRAFVFLRLDHNGTHDELELLPEWAYNNFGAKFLGNIYDL